MARGHRTGRCHGCGLGRTGPNHALVAPGPTRNGSPTPAAAWHRLLVRRSTGGPLGQPGQILNVPSEGATHRRQPDDSPAVSDGEVQSDWNLPTQPRAGSGLSALAPNTAQSARSGCMSNGLRRHEPTHPPLNAPPPPATARHVCLRPTQVARGAGAIYGGNDGARQANAAPGGDAHGHSNVQPW